MKVPLALVLIGWISLWTYYYVYWHQGHGQRASERIDASLRPETMTNLLIAGEDLEVQAEENIRFARSQAEPIIPEATEKALASVKDYFNEHQDEALVITGFYDDTESNRSLLPNLGMARAEAFKAWLTEFGVSHQQMATLAHENIDLSFLRDTLLDGLTFEVVDELPEEDLSEEELNNLEQKLRNSSQNLYFETGATSLIVSDTLRQYIFDLKRYLNTKTEASILVVGHTDNVGGAQQNLEYGRQRADFTRDLLGRAGINRVQIKTDSKGQSEPLTTNDTEEGRSKNRRVEIKLN
ncbi:OmpA family protein [Catalinimonas niigatensis]|uniref:OmpA family protein n=1 Tax=Catalinimonas niigatensis TaxID=1397264 RepID=UPI00266602E9|nr:OmpA family protein [Catalinimonas niigatensis]WPP50389.1 OmpA family protein [Catalinimonas niigatensis]